MVSGEARPVITPTSAAWHIVLKGALLPPAPPTTMARNALPAKSFSSAQISLSGLS